MLKRLPPILGNLFNNSGDYIDLLNPYNKNFTYESTHFPKYNFLPYRILRFLIFTLPVFILRQLVLPEICMPIDQYILYKHRNNPYVHIYYHWVWFIKDVIRGVLIPAWICVAVGMVCYLVVLDILGGCLRLIIKTK